MGLPSATGITLIFTYSCPRHGTLLTVRLVLDHSDARALLFHFTRLVLCHNNVTVLHVFCEAGAVVVHAGCYCGPLRFFFAFFVLFDRLT